MPYRVIGFGPYDMETSAVLIEDGIVRTAMQEERLNRQKYAKGFPYKSIRKCLEINNLELEDIDAFAYPFGNEYKFFITDHLKTLVRHPIDSLLNYGTFTKTLKYRLHKHRAYEGEFRTVFSHRLKIPYEKIKFHNHHKSHFASAIYTSGFKEAAGLCIDLEGEGDSTTGWVYKNGQIRQLFTIRYPHSLGLFYNRVTTFLGFAPRDEYKVMGLAAMGKPTYCDKIRDVIVKTSDGYRINTKYFNRLTGYDLSPVFYKAFGPAYPDHDDIDERMADIACSMQYVYEDILAHMASLIRQRTGIDYLTLAGGCALNTKANGKLFESGEFKGIYIPPSAGDCGVSLGAAFLQYNADNVPLQPYKLKSDALGPEYADSDILEQLQRSNIRYEKCDDVPRKAAELLAAGNIVGWFHGKMEYGPRALCSRSILADPRSADMKDKVNMAIKFREPFRPFAPVCLDTRKDEYFDGPAENPFMTFTVNVKPEKKDAIPAVVHFDGTSRLQTVNAEDQPRVGRLLSEFEKISGVPVLMNTSFNIANEPIVCSPADAIRTFFTSGLDALFLEDYLVLKNPN